MAISIKKLAPELVEDYLYLFDNMHFTEHPEWSACYCYSFHFTGKKEEWNKEDNRSAVIKMIQENQIRGYLAYAESKAVGWCNANERSNYQALQQYYNVPDNGHLKICSIVCFLIDPAFRKQGIAKKILEQIIIDYQELDFDFLEAYPGKQEKSCEGHYKGPLSMYEKQGFEIIADFQKYHVVRKNLNK